MNTENKLPVLRPEDKPAIPEPADTAAPAEEKASRWKRPETHEEKMLFWMRVTGLGLGNGKQKFLYLPEAQNDFIFAVVCEELGLIGACLILILFALLIIRGYWLALHARDKFGSLIIVGVTTLLAFQVFANVAVVTNLFPVTGISLPFFSSGGSALVIQLAEMGLILGISRQNPVT